MIQTLKKLINKIKAYLKERRIKRFKARLKEAYPDAKKLLDRVSWLSKDEGMINAWIHAHDFTCYRSLSQEEMQLIRDRFQ